MYVVVESNERWKGLKLKMEGAFEMQNSWDQPLTSQRVKVESEAYLFLLTRVDLG